MNHADVQIAAYQDAIHICQQVADCYGSMPQVACRTIERELEERIAEIMRGICHEKAAHEFGPLPA